MYASPLKLQFYEKETQSSKKYDFDPGWMRPLRRCNQSLLHSPQSARIVPIYQGAHNVNAQRFYHKSHLGQVSQLWSLPTQLIKHAAVEGLLLLTTMTQFGQIRVIQTRPVLREGLCTISLDLPARHSPIRDFISKIKYARLGLKYSEH